MYYRGAHGVIIVFDITRRDTFENASIWIEEIIRHHPDPIGKILVGNKVDLESNRTVSWEDASQLANSIGALYIETSAKTSTGVHEAFGLLVNSINQIVAPMEG